MTCITWTNEFPKGADIVCLSLCPLFIYIYIYMTNLMVLMTVTRGRFLLIVSYRDYFLHIRLTCRFCAPSSWNQQLPQSRIFFQVPCSGCHCTSTPPPRSKHISNGANLPPSRRGPAQPSPAKTKSSLPV